MCHNWWDSWTGNPSLIVSNAYLVIKYVSFLIKSCNLFFEFQEVIKAISRKGQPIKNFFYFDAMDGNGVVEDISKPNPAS